jgi:hypothetical protein
MVLGALTMLFAEARCRAPSSLEAGLRRALLAVPQSQFGFSDWARHAAYALAACDGEPPPLPAWIVGGVESDASPIGLPGAWSPPGSSDLYRV